LALGLCAALGVCSAAAQTVYIRNAAPGAPLELALNANRVATATADAQGAGSLAVPPSGDPKDPEVDRHVYVDVCGNMRRVMLVDVGLQPPSSDSLCQRTEVPDLFAMHANSSLVIDASAARPTILIRQGPPPDSWLHPRVEGTRTERRRLPAGLIVSGGVTGVRFGNVESVACGTADTCSGNDTRGALTGSASFWLTQFLAVEASYLRPQEVTTSGSGTNYTFNSIFQSQVLTLSGKIGVRAGPVRFYGLAGADHTWSTASTTQTVTPASTGGRETFALDAAELKRGSTSGSACTPKVDGRSSKATA
jgi:hypothetical protein